VSSPRRDLSIVALAVYVVSLPWLRPALGSWSLVDKTLVASDLAFGLLALAIARDWWRGRARLALRPSLLAAVSAPMFVVGASLLTHGLSRAAGVEALRVSYSLVLLLVIGSLRLGAREQLLLARAWCAAALSVCFVGLASFLGVIVFGMPESFLARVNSPLFLPGVVRLAGVMETNALTLYFTVSVGFVALLLNHGEQADRRLADATLVGMLACAPFTLSRGLVGFALALWLTARSARGPERLRRARGTLLLALLLLTTLAIPATLFGVSPIRGGAEEGGLLLWLDGRPNAYRVIHTAGLRMLITHPIQGVGLAAFRPHFGGFASAEELQGAWPSLEVTTAWDPHSFWIRWGAETGFPGLLAWAALWAFLLSQLLRGALPGKSALGPFVGFAVIGLLVNGLHVDFSHIKFVWAAVGIGLAAAGEKRVSEVTQAEGA
jgi:O-antigen ligase